MKSFVAGLALALSVSGAAFAGNAAEPVGEPQQELPTLRSLGVYWVVKGDDNANATVTCEYRKVKLSDPNVPWQKAPNLWRVEKGRHKNEKGKSSVDVPEGAWLFAGSALMLEPQTRYELKLTLTDPDGGSVEKTFMQSTIGEPVTPEGLKEVHVVPGSGSGAGTAADPYKGLNAALEAVGPGTILLLHKGNYDGPFVIKRSGEPGKPIIFRGAGDGAATLDGRCPPDKREGAAVDLVGQHDLWFEDLAIANTWNAMKAHGAQNIVVRRVHMHDVNCGFFATVNQPNVMKNFFITDNLVEGPEPWPSTDKDWHSPPEARGIWVGGQGHVVAYNRVHHMKDGLDTAEELPCSAIDFHNNDISECVDDGAEMDGSERNTRCFLNRFTNTLTGLSFQPVYGGPCYAFRNVAYNFRTDATKLKAKPSGVLLVHNTFVHMGAAWSVNTPAPVSNCYSRNNIFIGTKGPAVMFDMKVTGCDFDYDGFGGWDGPRFMKFNGNFATPEDVRKNATIEKHLILLDPAKVFASGLLPPTVNPNFKEGTEVGTGTIDLQIYPVEKVDARLKPDGGAVGVGEKLVGYGDAAEAAPYLGAYPPGAELPHYGPRPVEK